jgi:hypothetical protein
MVEGKSRQITEGYFWMAKGSAKRAGRPAERFSLTGCYRAEPRVKVIMSSTSSSGLVIIGQCPDSMTL